MAGSSLEITEYETPDGEIFRFTAGTKFLLTEEGFGMPDIKYITQSGPFQHGDTYLGYTLNPRVIQLLIRENQCSREEYWTARRNIVNILRPNRQTIGSFDPGILRRIFSDGSMREIKVHILSGPTFVARDLTRWDEWAYQDTIRFVAPDPTFYDPTTYSESVSYSLYDSVIFYNSSTGSSATDVVFYNSVTAPTSSGLVFAEDFINASKNCTNSGNWLVYPDITIVGPVTGAVITNDTTGEKLQINRDIATGETAKIELAYGAKRVYITQTNENIIGSVSQDSDLATFHLEPDPGATSGVNSINMFGMHASVGVTSITISWQNRYLDL